LAVCAYAGFRKGLVLTVYRFVSFVLALILAWWLYPVVARFLRNSFIFESLRGRIATAANIEGVFRDNIPDPSIPESIRGNEIINSLPLPQSLRDMLYEGNTPDMFELFRVNTIEEYITGFFANIVINVISLVIVFLIVLLILHFVGRAIKIVDMIPVVNTFNSAGGLIAGVLIGALVVWLGLTVAMMFYSVSVNEGIYGFLQGSLLTGWLVDSGWLFNRMTAI